MKEHQINIVLGFQVLTIDLENQAAELQEEELPVAVPIINIPHISARCCTQSSIVCCFSVHFLLLTNNNGSIWLNHSQAI